jgi:hypothetical protein
LHLAGFLLDLHFTLENGGDKFLRISVDFYRTVQQYNQKIVLNIATAVRTSNPITFFVRFT